ncbi:MAG TPA: hypothetical protein VK501_24760 [Baekduia sp.]|uniref:hypothetical protein n=1 Tax=Baekduia sp. TaxID=2600305 RepID=UPI002B50E19E|nr:hypothetical protein [Baekduia sp.]HMJ37140.1 hypothetical protein [Baekduia sp.]
MIEALAGDAAHEELMQGWGTGDAGRFGYAFLELATGAVVQARRSNAQQPGAFREQPAGSGVVVATLAIPATGVYELVVDDGVNVRAAELRSSSAPPGPAPGVGGLWTTVEGLRSVAYNYGLAVPDDDDRCLRLLAHAQRDLQVHVLGWRVAPMVLSAAQQAALAQATATQALWRLQMDRDDLLAVDAPIGSIDGVGLIDRPTARISRAAVEELVGWDLIRRAPTAP